MLQVGPALWYLVTPIQPWFTKVFNALAHLLYTTPRAVRAMITLVISLALVCDGFRVRSQAVGGRVALTGVVGGIATLVYR